MTAAFKDYEFYKSVLTDLTKQHCFNWQDIKSRIEKTEHRPENWMDVRVVLQDFVSRNIIERDFSDIYVERYSVKN